MTPQDMARLHATCFTTPRPWSADEFATLLAAPATLLALDAQGFALGQIIADEAELLTIATAPAARRRGLGRRLLAEFLAQAQGRGAHAIFLEVAATNAPALALYQSAGFVRAGLRPRYYHAPDGTLTDALILRRNAPDLCTP
jgi:ribosomal-protein-alanine N-acetyltransferase